MPGVIPLPQPDRNRISMPVRNSPVGAPRLLWVRAGRSKVFRIRHLMAVPGDPCPAGDSRTNPNEAIEINHIESAGYAMIDQNEATAINCFNLLLLHRKMAVFSKKMNGDAHFTIPVWRNHRIWRLENRNWKFENENWQNQFRAISNLPGSLFSNCFAARG